MNASLLCDRAAVEAAVPAWRELLADSACNEPTLSPEWLLTWWDVYGSHQGRQLRFVRFDAAGKLVGLAPLLLRRHWYRPGVPFRRLEPLGSGEREADAVCSDYLNVIARRGHEVGVARTFADALRSGTLGGWDELVMPLMAGDGPMPALLAESCREAGFEAEVVTTTEAPYVPLPPTWDAYLAALGRKERYLVKRTLRDFAQWAGDDAVFHRATNAAELEEGKRVLRELHVERWEGTGGGTFRSPLFLDFHDQVMGRLLGAGALELLWLTVRGEPIATTYSLRWDRKLHFYQCGRKMTVPKDVRPGGVLLYHAIRAAIESDLREFDFLGGVATYKRQLALASRSLVRLRVNRRCVVEGLRKAIERGKSWLRPFVRRFGPAPAEQVAVTQPHEQDSAKVPQSSHTQQTHTVSKGEQQPLELC
jgi:CelD/BcsL family acetyltransferase involved in cellulose biosynthesis